MRRSSIFFLLTALKILIIIALFVHSRIELSNRMTLWKDLEGIVSTLKLTDMALFTDARYARHPTQADLFSAFQDYPGSIEHFPTGTIVPPPEFDSVETVIKIK
ncbi:MAG: hypothetical protein HZA07_07020 [Nitrospirae bacterium]|nr:hypothetical protein [Nitrospirota bacterium]